MWGSLKSLARACALLALGAAAAHAGGPGTTGGNAVKLPAAARPTALGGAYVGLADDPAALLWNPAGLAYVTTPEAAFMHAPYVADTSFEVLSYAQPLGPLGTVAGSFHYLNYGDLPSTADAGGLYGGVSGATAPSDIFLMGGWGTALPPLFGLDRLKAGATAKLTMQQLTAGTAVGVGITGGALWDTPVEGLRAGTTIDNIGGTTGDGSLLPLSWVAGGSYTRAFNRDVRGVALLDLRAALDSGIQFATGLEVTAYRQFTFRAGWRGGGAIGGLTIGGGILQPVNWLGRTMVFKLDFAHADAGELGSSQRFQLGVMLGARAPAEPAPAPAALSPAEPVTATVLAAAAPATSTVLAGAPVTSTVMVATPVSSTVLAGAPVTSTVTASTPVPVGVAGLAVVRAGADSVLTWTGPGPAYHVLLRKPADKEYFWLTISPVAETRYPLLGIPPGRYLIKVRTVDPAKPDWKGPESADFAFTLEPPAAAPAKR